MNERELRDAIRGVGADDASRAPTFGSVRDRQVTRAVVGGRVLALAGTAALAVLVVAVATYRAVPPRPLVVPDEVIALTEWRPPTDALLEMSGPSVLDVMPPSASLMPPLLSLDLPQEVP